MVKNMPKRIEPEATWERCRNESKLYHSGMKYKTIEAKPEKMPKKQKTNHRCIPGTPEKTTQRIEAGKRLIHSSQPQLTP